MNCNCYDERLENTKKRLKENSSILGDIDMGSISVNWNTKTLRFEGVKDTPPVVPEMEITYTKLKADKSKYKKESTMKVFTKPEYCCFCGRKLDNE